MFLRQEIDEDADCDDELNPGPPNLIALALAPEHVRNTAAVIPMPCEATYFVTISQDF